MKKAVRDCLSVTLLPVILLLGSAILPKATFNANFDMDAYLFYIASRYIFMILAGVFLARIVNISVSSYKSRWLLPIVILELTIFLTILLLRPLRLLLLDFLSEITVGILLLLIGNCLFLLVKSCYLRLKTN